MAPRCGTRLLAAVTLVTVAFAAGVVVYRWNGADTITDTERNINSFGNEEMATFSRRVKDALDSGMLSASNSNVVVTTQNSEQQPTLWGFSINRYHRRALDETIHGYGYEDYGDYGEGYGYEDDVDDDGEEPSESTSTPTPTPSSTPTPSPTPDQTTAPEVVSLRGTVSAAGSIRDASVFMDFGSGTPPPETGKSSKTGAFSVNVSSNSKNGDLIVLPGGEDLFTGASVSFALKMPLATQLLEEPENVVVSPMSTLAFYTRMYVVASLENLLDRVRIALDLKGFPAGSNKDLAYYDPLTRAGAAAFNNETDQLRAAVINAVANFNLMSVVSSTASLYSGACQVEKAVAGEWAFQAMAEAGTRHKKKLNLTNEVFVKELMTSDTLAAFCSGALGSGSATRRMLSTDFATIKAQLIEDAAVVAKATVELNVHLEQAIKATPPSKDTLGETIELVAVHSIVSQRALADQTERLAKGQVGNDQFAALYTGEALVTTLDEMEIPQTVQQNIKQTVAVMLKLEDPVPVDDVERRFTAAEIVGMVVGPLLFIALVVTGVVLVLLFINHRKQRVQAFDDENDPEEGLINTADQEAHEHECESPSKTDESTYYKMPAPAPLPAKKDMLAPAAKASADTELDLVAEAKKVQEEKARQEFEAILKVQQEQIMSNKLANDAATSEEPRQQELSLASKPEGLPDIPPASADHTISAEHASDDNNDTQTPEPSEPVAAAAAETPKQEEPNEPSHPDVPASAEPEPAEPPATAESAPLAPEENPLETPQSPAEAEKEEPLMNLPGQGNEDIEADEGQAASQQDTGAAASS